MSRKQPCLYVKQTGYGKYFIVDFNNLESTFIKSLVHMNSVPESWGTPTSEELDELKRINSLLMKEEVVLSGEEYIESELVRCIIFKLERRYCFLYNLYYLKFHIRIVDCYIFFYFSIFLLL